jgi:putative transposase
MSRYRRSTGGTTFFFTVVTHKRRAILCNEPVISVLRDAISRVRQTRPFVIDALVLLPDHLHCVWTLPSGDADFSIRWSLIKHHVSYVCGNRYVEAAPTPSRRKHRDGGVWQRRFWEHRIRDDADLQRHVDYIHFNPVKHGLTRQASQWRYSSFHRYVTEGLYPSDWGGVAGHEDLDFE